MAPSGLVYWGFLAAMYAIITAGNAMAIIIPAKTPVVLTVLKRNPAVPNASTMDSTTKVVALALLLVETPPSSMPVARNIRPSIMVSPVRACMPSMNVWARPAYDMTTPTRPMDVSPMPGIIRSQLLIYARPWSLSN